MAIDANRIQTGTDTSLTTAGITGDTHGFTAFDNSTGDGVTLIFDTNTPDTPAGDEDTFSLQRNNAGNSAVPGAGEWNVSTTFLGGTAETSADPANWVGGGFLIDTSNTFTNIGDANVGDITTITLAAENGDVVLTVQSGQVSGTDYDFDITAATGPALSTGDWPNLFVNGAAIDITFSTGAGGQSVNTVIATGYDGTREAINEGGIVVRGNLTVPVNETLLLNSLGNTSNDSRQGNNNITAAGYTLDDTNAVLTLQGYAGDATSTAVIKTNSPTYSNPLNPGSPAAIGISRGVLALEGNVELEGSLVFDAFNRLYDRVSSQGGQLGITQTEGSTLYLTNRSTNKREYLSYQRNGNGSSFRTTGNSFRRVVLQGVDFYDASRGNASSANCFPEQAIAVDSVIANDQSGTNVLTTFAFYDFFANTATVNGFNSDVTFASSNGSSTGNAANWYYFANHLPRSGQETPFTAGRNYTGRRGLGLAAYDREVIASDAGRLILPETLNRDVANNDPDTPVTQNLVTALGSNYSKTAQGVTAAFTPDGNGFLQDITATVGQTVRFRTSMGFSTLANNPGWDNYRPLSNAQIRNNNFYYYGTGEGLSQLMYARPLNWTANEVTPAMDTSTVAHPGLVNVDTTDAGTIGVGLSADGLGGTVTIAVSNSLDQLASRIKDAEHTRLYARANTLYTTDQATAEAFIVSNIPQNGTTDTLVLDGWNWTSLADGALTEGSRYNSLNVGAGTVDVDVNPVQIGLTTTTALGHDFEDGDTIIDGTADQRVMDFTINLAPGSYTIRNASLGSNFAVNRTGSTGTVTLVYDNVANEGNATLGAGVQVAKTLTVNFNAGLTGLTVFPVVSGAAVIADRVFLAVDATATSAAFASTSYSALAGSDFLVIGSGPGRRPRMARVGLPASTTVILSNQEDPYPDTVDIATYTFNFATWNTTAAPNALAIGTSSAVPTTPQQDNRLWQDNVRGTDVYHRALGEAITLASWITIPADGEQETLNLDQSRGVANEVALNGRFFKFTSGTAITDEAHQYVENTARNTVGQTFNEENDLVGIRISDVVETTERDTIDVPDLISDATTHLRFTFEERTTTGAVANTHNVTTTAIDVSGQTVASRRMTAATALAVAYNAYVDAQPDGSIFKQTFAAVNTLEYRVIIAEDQDLAITRTDTGGEIQGRVVPTALSFSTDGSAYTAYPTDDVNIIINYSGDPGGTFSRRNLGATVGETALETTPSSLVAALLPALRLETLKANPDETGREAVGNAVLEQFATEGIVTRESSEGAADGGVFVEDFR